MSMHIKYVVLTLAILAVACAQVFGMERGFLCDCGGIEKVTPLDHCHGPHSAACHEEETHEHCQDSESHEEGDSHEHQALVESLLASISSGIEFTAPTLIAVDFAVMDWEAPAMTVLTSVLAANGYEGSQHVTARPWPDVLTHAVALRI